MSHRLLPTRADFRRHRLSPAQAARLLLAALVVFKLGILAWNVSVYDTMEYDQHMHRARARSGGLENEGRSYNPPIYYLPGLISRETDAQREAYISDRKSKSPKRRTEAKRERRARDMVRIGHIRWSNLLWLGLFYFAWIFCIFPRMLPHWRQSFAASLVLLCLPGYQKLGTMAHPDNALIGATALSTGLWVWFRERKRLALARGARAGREWAEVVWLGLSTIVATLTRPFGVITAAATWAGTLVHLARGRKLLSGAFAARALLMTLLVAVALAAWPAYQALAWGEKGEIYDDKYLDEYLPHREGFDYAHYLTSSYPLLLLKAPNRDFKDLPIDEHERLVDVKTPEGKAARIQVDKYENPRANSFWTLFYSDFWGDHWLYFSGKIFDEEKLWPKRILLVWAFPGTVWFLVRFLLGCARFVRRLVRAPRELQRWEIEGYALVFTLLGMGSFMYWQLTEGLTPGKQSGVKFAYVGYFVPFALVVALGPRLRRWENRLLLPYLGVLFGAALPAAIFYPSGW